MTCLDDSKHIFPKVLFIRIFPETDFFRQRVLVSQHFLEKEKKKKESWFPPWKTPTICN